MLQHTRLVSHASGIRTKPAPHQTSMNYKKQNPPVEGGRVLSGHDTTFNGITNSLSMHLLADSAKGKGVDLTNPLI